MILRNWFVSTLARLHLGLKLSWMAERGYHVEAQSCMCSPMKV